MTLIRILLVLSTTLLAACTQEQPEDHHAHGVAAEFERGPHRGRLLRDGDFALEVTIFETGVPPQYRLYAYRNDDPLPASEVQASIQLSRLDGEVNHFEFSAEGDVLVGSGTVTEPHSFDVLVNARNGDQEYRWSFDSYEGRTTIPAAIAAAAGVTTESAGPATIHDRLGLLGKIVLNADRFAEVRSRFNGPVREVRVAVGDQVKVGQVLAVVENSDTMRSFTVTSPISGLVLAKHTNVGDVAGDRGLFEIANFSTVWVDLHVFGADVERIAAGQSMRVLGAIDGQSIETQIDRILPLANAASQSVIARALLPNPDGRWRPGMAVSADVNVGSREVPLAVKRIGLQRFRDFTTVFAQIGESYEVRMLELGAQDDVHVEVLGGLKPSTVYVTEQSFLIKADIEKSGASHDH